MRRETQIYKNKVFLAPILDKSIEFFFSRVLKYFQNELKHLTQSLYINSGEHIFDGIEQTWVGILNNAVIKAFPQCATLQEFSVTKGPKQYGRADYFVRFENNEEKTDLLFEAKSIEEKGRPYKVEKMNEWYDQLLKKAYGYYEPEEERKYYLPRTFMTAIVFGWIREGNTLEKVKEEMEIFLKDQKDDKTDFCALYHGSERGIWVYGRVKAASEFHLLGGNWEKDAQ